MSIFLKMAWRNIWRNKTRTFLTACVVFIAVVLSILMTSEQYGMYDKMIDNVIEITGHLQVQHKEYGGNKSINNSVAADSALLGKIQKVPGVARVTSHLESFALASYREMTKGVMVIGVVPSQEEGFSKLRKKLSKQAGQASSYLTDDDEGVLLGEKLADYLKVGIGDTLVMISQGYHGISAAGLFPVRGLIRFPSVEIEGSIVYMSLPAARKFYGASGLSTSVLIKADDPSHIDPVKKEVGAFLSEENCVKTWQELQPEIVQMIDSDISTGYFMKGIFYMIITFIIFSTLVMMMYERRREFGIMLAMGLQKFRLSVVVFIEIFLITVLGTLVGLGIGYLVTYVLNQHPIPLSGEMAKLMEDYGFEPVIFFSIGIDIFYWQPVVVFCITLFLYIFPLISIRNLKIVRAIRG